MVTEKLYDVFGVSRELPKTYIERVLVDGKLVENLSVDKHVIIYGSSKQGKTCLRKHCLYDHDSIVVQCQNNWTLPKLSEAILKQAGYRVELSSSKTTSGESKYTLTGEVGGNALLVKSKIKSDRVKTEFSSENATTVELDIDPSDPNDLVSALKKLNFKKFVVLEDFHYLPEETQKDFAFFLKTIHETSSITFIIVAVWREENRLILLNGDLSGRVVSVDADSWEEEDLLKVISKGEKLLNIEFPADFKSGIIEQSLKSVYIVQDSCYRACKDAEIVETAPTKVLISDIASPQEYVKNVVTESGARYSTFLTNFAAGFQETDLQMYRWVLLPLLSENIEKLEKGLSYSEIRSKLQANHPRGSELNPGNITQALTSASALQAKKNIKPFILDYDQANLRLSVVDKGFLIWLSLQDRNSLLADLGLPQVSEEL